MPQPPLDDPFHLHRFLEAQATTFDQALGELRGGQKRSHWMWFIFPQIAGLGHSAMAQRYSIGNLDEAAAYLAHPILGARLRDTTCAVNAVAGRSLAQIFGYPDDLKFHSSITLFAAAATHAVLDEPLFARTLTQWFDGRPDAATVHLVLPSL